MGAHAYACEYASARVRGCACGVCMFVSVCMCERLSRVCVCACGCGRAYVGVCVYSVHSDTPSLYFIFVLTRQHFTRLSIHHISQCRTLSICREWRISKQYQQKYDAKPLHFDKVTTLSEIQFCPPLTAIKLVSILCGVMYLNK